MFEMVGHIKSNPYITYRHSEAKKKRIARGGKPRKLDLTNV